MRKILILFLVQIFIINSLVILSDNDLVKADTGLIFPNIDTDYIYNISFLFICWNP
jgi:hypothetical protein